MRAFLFFSLLVVILYKPNRVPMKAIVLLLVVFSSISVFCQQNDAKLKKESTNKLVVKATKINAKHPVIKPAYPTEEYLQKHRVPADFPRYKDTGNPKLDAARYHEEKQKWINKNPEAYEKIKHLNL